MNSQSIKIFAYTNDYSFVPRIIDENFDIIREFIENKFCSKRTCSAECSLNNTKYVYGMLSVFERAGKEIDFHWDCANQKACSACFSLKNQKGDIVNKNSPINVIFEKKNYDIFLELI